MKAKIDICLTRSQVEQLSKLFDENPSAPSITIGCTVNLAEIKFDDFYTTATLRCR